MWWWHLPTQQGGWQKAGRIVVNQMHHRRTPCQSLRHNAIIVRSLLIAASENLCFSSVTETKRRTPWQGSRKGWTISEKGGKKNKWRPSNTPSAPPSTLRAFEVGQAQCLFLCSGGANRTRLIQLQSTRCMRCGETLNQRSETNWALICFRRLSQTVGGFAFLVNQR